MLESSGTARTPCKHMHPEILAPP